MEHLEGQTLAERLASGSKSKGTNKTGKPASSTGSGVPGEAQAGGRGQGLPLLDALEYAIQIADALAKAHRQGIVHRDIKPGNVMLTREGAKLLDFGLATSKAAALAPADLTVSLTREANTAAGMVVGTVPYMAPEQLEGHEADARTDIFAFGAMLYEMVSGRRAFEESSQASLIAAIMTRDPEPLATLVPVTPPSLDRMVRQCLAKDPDKRWQSAGDLARQLEWTREEIRTPRSATGQVLAQPVQRPSPRKRLVAAALALVVFAGIAAGAFVLGRRGGDRPLPSFRRLTFRRGTIDGARFMPDGQNIVFAARWDGDPRQVFSVRYDSVDATLREGLQGMNIQAVSSRNELALFRGGTVAKVPLAGGAPRDLLSAVSSADWNPDGSQMAVTRPVTATSPSVVEFPIGKLIYKASATAATVRMSPGGDLLAFRDVALDSHGVVVIIDTAGHKKAESSFQDGLEGLAWTPDGREVWYSTSIPGARVAVRALDRSGRERNVLTDPVLRLKDISRDGRVLLSADDRIYSINGRAPGSATERNLTWYNWSMLDDMSPDGRTIVFTEGGESDSQNGWNTFVRPTDGSPPQRFDEFIYARRSPDGKWLAGMAPDKKGLQVKFMPVGAGDGRFVTHDASDGEVVGWLPDSSGIVYWVFDRVWLAMLDGRAPTPITPDGWMSFGMGPDGQHVLAVPSAPGDVRMFLYSIDGREKILLPGVTASKWYPVGWDADGKRMRAIATPRGYPMRIFRVDPMTGDAQAWKEIGGQLDRAGLTPTRRLRFSADGESYAYNYARTLSTLYVVEGLR